VTKSKSEHIISLLSIILSLLIRDTYPIMSYILLAYSALFTALSIYYAILEKRLYKAKLEADIITEKYICQKEHCPNFALEGRLFCHLHMPIEKK
jgi:hypothetical protein